jgi:hypothetical protein
MQLIGPSDNTRNAEAEDELKPRSMTRAGARAEGAARAEGLGKGLIVIVRGLLRPSKRRQVLDSEVTD